MIGDYTFGTGRYTLIIGFLTLGIGDCTFDVGSYTLALAIILLVLDLIK